MSPNDPERSGDGVSDLVRRRALDAAPLGVVITDPMAADNPIVYANDAFYRLTGYGPEETLGRNCRFLQGPETDPDRIAELRAAVDTAESASTVLRNYRRDGTSGTTSRSRHSRTTAPSRTSSGSSTTSPT
jgi:PAS domain S-box-containing protein